MLQNAYWRFHLYKSQKSAKLIYGIRVTGNWVGDKREGFWDADDILFFGLGVTQACCLCDNSQDCTFLLCVLFCMYVKLQLKKFIKMKKKQGGWKGRWSATAHSSDSMLEASLWQCEEWKQKVNDRKMRMSTMGGELGRSWAIGTGIPRGRYCGDYQAQVVR